MIGLFLITHGSLGESLIQCACHVLNKRPVQIVQLGMAAQDDPLDALPLARELMTLVDKGEGVLILTDIYGATPANVAMKLLEPGRIEGVAGVNLPMLLRAVSYRHEPLEALAARAVTGGTQGVMQVAVTAPQNQTRRNHAKDQHDHQQ